MQSYDLFTLQRIILLDLSSRMERTLEPRPLQHFILAGMHVLVGRYSIYLARSNVLGIHPKDVLVSIDENGDVTYIFLKWII